MTYPPVDHAPAVRVAERIRVELARRRLSGAELARRIQRSQSSTARRLAGEVPFDINELSQIAAVLEIPLGTLVDDEQAA